MELDLPKTIGAFALVIAIGIGALLAMPVDMATSTILMMVLPSMILFGAIMLAIGVAHGEYRAVQ